MAKNKKTNVGGDTAAVWAVEVAESDKLFILQFDDGSKASRQLVYDDLTNKGYTVTSMTPKH